MTNCVPWGPVELETFLKTRMGGGGWGCPVPEPGCRCSLADHSWVELGLEARVCLLFLLALGVFPSGGWRPCPRQQESTWQGLSLVPACVHSGMATVSFRPQAWEVTHKPAPHAGAPFLPVGGEQVLSGPSHRPRVQLLSPGQSVLPQGSLGLAGVLVGAGQTQQCQEWTWGLLGGALGEKDLW